MVSRISFLIAMVAMLVFGRLPQSCSAYGAMVNGLNTSVPNSSPESHHLEPQRSLDDEGIVIDSIRTPYAYSTGLTWDGEQFWCADNCGQIFRITQTGEVTREFSVSTETGGPSGLEWDGTNLWLVVEEDMMIYKLNPEDGSIVDSFDVSSICQGNANGWDVTWDGQFMWYTVYFYPQSNMTTFNQLDPSDMHVITSFPLRSAILGIYWNGQELCGIDRDTQQLWRINPADTSIYGRIDWSASNALDLTWDGTHWWFTRNSLGWIYKADIVLPAPDTDNSPKPRTVSLVQNYPNPFNPLTTIGFDLTVSSSVSLTVFDMTGRRVARLADGVFAPGMHSVTFNGQNLPSGMYICKMETNGFVDQRKMMLIK